MIKQFAFVFPGQGSQTVGMLSTLVTKYPFIKKVFNKASDILCYDLWKLIQYGPSKKLNRTYYAQPALLTASVAIWQVWQHLGGQTPSLVAGHSLGEYSALVCAKVISFSDAVRLVKLRGKLMQEAVPEGSGAMVAIIGLDDVSIIEICKELKKDQVVSPANFNCPGQVVIAGHKEAVKRVSLACKDRGAKRVILLPISVPSHCMLMKHAAEKLEVELKKITFNIPTILLVNNVDIKCETIPKAIRNALIRQLYNPVYWTKIIKFIYEQGISHVYEVGPGKVLTNLTKHIISTLNVSSINEPYKILSALAELQ